MYSLVPQSSYPANNLTWIYYTQELLKSPVQTPFCIGKRAAARVAVIIYHPVFLNAIAEDHSGGFRGAGRGLLVASSPP